MFRKALVSLLPLTLSVASLACTGSDPSLGGGEQPDVNGDAPLPPRPANDGGAPVGDPDAAAPADVGRVVAYAYSSNESDPESIPNAAYSFNASGGAIKITRTGTGTYRVAFDGLTLDKAVPLVTAYDSVGGLCHWSKNEGNVVDVRCLNVAGSVSDEKFVVTVFDKGPLAGASVLGFAHANDPMSASYTPDVSRSNNAAGGGTLTATRSAVGVYKMEFGGLAVGDIGSVQVTPYGDLAGRCAIDFWLGANVHVRCYDGSGAPADLHYAILVAGKKAGATATVAAFAHAAEEASASYAPTLAYNSGAGNVTATRSAAGTYAIDFAGMNLDIGAHVQVTAQSKGRRCNVNTWGGSNVELTCVNGAGSKLDNNYGVVVLK